VSFFQSRHEVWLEQEVERLRSAHEKELARLELRIEDLKKSHADELSRAITVNQSLRDELERTRIVLTPALQTAVLPKERDETPPPKPSKEPVPFVGTPWQRVQANYFAQLEEEEKMKASNFVKPVNTPVEGENNGSSRDGRIEAPLGEQSKTA
jgi:hypothetical protein